MSEKFVGSFNLIMQNSSMFVGEEGKWRRKFVGIGVSLAGITKDKCNGKCAKLSAMSR